MISLLTLIGLLVLVGYSLCFEISKHTAFTLVTVYISAITFFQPLLLSAIYLSVLILAVGFCFYPTFRQSVISKPLFNYVAKVMPPISDTEMVALKAGDVWLEGGLFKGNPGWAEVDSLRKPSLTTKEQAFIDNECEVLCSLIDDWQQNQDGDLSPDVWQYIKDNGFLGLVIPNSYGGKGFSAFAHSTIVMKIASRSTSTAVTVMVPNSLGPAELLLHYGTAEQKNQYLPKLAAAEHIPCFALTSPNAGSDAGAINDRGTLFKQGGNLYIRLSWEKRYITLAPVATLLGLAFKLNDPENLLERGGAELGITVALIPTSHEGVSVGNKHQPMGLSFSNGTTTGKDVVIPADWVVGGVEMAGEGWRMLMECLSIGRSISLPALATAAAKVSYRTTGAYAKLRKQFRLPIGKFEGVQEALGRIGGYTYMMEATRKLTSDSVGLGIKPSLISAITKYHLTELGRVVVNDSMDIHGGRAIQLGERNYIGLQYISIPISITVEGANILTRNLMIFGQGAMRCHPFLQQEVESVNHADKSLGLKAFDELLLQHLTYSLKNISKMIGSSFTGGKFIQTMKHDRSSRYYKQLTRMSYGLSVSADIALAFLGGDLKRKERLSARLGDVLSYLYIGMASLKYYHDGKKSNEATIHLDYALETCLHQIQLAFEGFFANFPSRPIAVVLKRLIFPWGLPYRGPSDRLAQKVAESMLSTSTFRDDLTDNCFIGKPTDSVGRLEKAFFLGESVANLEKKVLHAVIKGELGKEELFKDYIIKALDKGLIDKDELRQLNEYINAVNDAMLVDEFSTPIIKQRKKEHDKNKRERDISC